MWNLAPEGVSKSFPLKIMGFQLMAINCYVTFLGGLSHWVQLANTRDDCKFLLVDKSSVRYKVSSYNFKKLF